MNTVQNIEIENDRQNLSYILICSTPSFSQSRLSNFKGKKSQACSIKNGGIEISWSTATSNSS